MAIFILFNSPWILIIIEILLLLPMALSWEVSLKVAIFLGILESISFLIGCYFYLKLSQAFEVGND